MVNILWRAPPVAGVGGLLINSEVTVKPKPVTVKQAQQCDG